MSGQCQEAAILVSVSITGPSCVAIDPYNDISTVWYDEVSRRDTDDSIWLYTALCVTGSTLHYIGGRSGQRSGRVHTCGFRFFTDAIASYNKYQQLLPDLAD